MEKNVNKVTPPLKRTRGDSVERNNNPLSNLLAYDSDTTMNQDFGEKEDKDQEKNEDLDNDNIEKYENLDQDINNSEDFVKQYLNKLDDAPTQALETLLNAFIDILKDPQAAQDARDSNRRFQEFKITSKGALKKLMKNFKDQLQKSRSFQALVVEFTKQNTGAYLSKKYLTDVLYRLLAFLTYIERQTSLIVEDSNWTTKKVMQNFKLLLKKTITEYNKDKDPLERIAEPFMKRKGGK